MIFEPVPIEGAWHVRLSRREDDRGFFARTWCRDEFAAHGIDASLSQTSISYNRLGGTLRGMHFAWPPAREGKLVRCERGRIHDVIVDLRPGSPTYLHHWAVTLGEDDQDALFIPPFVAHGFQTLLPETTVLYMMTEAYRPQAAGGLRHDDPAFGIRWPVPVASIAERDRAYPLFDRDAHEAACTAAAATGAVR